MSETPYQRLGGEPAIRRWVGRFYELMDELPEAYRARKIHPKDLAPSGEKLVMFLSGWLGGPQLYQEKFGHPRLRRRHLPFPIGPAEREEWLMCMRAAMEETIADGELRAQLYAAILPLAMHMLNQGEAAPACPSLPSGASPSACSTSVESRRSE
ncbi:MAG: group II truncated hemoglobin [Betaproteobacteria bacterium]|nr:group II truncated hemoglobin [Betaproteobacteria bacterium]